METVFDQPFRENSSGIRIIKSHVFCHNIDHLRKEFADCAIVMVYRSDDACLGWWVKCGHFDITYPDYHEYFKDLKTMAKMIDWQNRDIRTAWDYYDGVIARDNQELASILGIQTPPEEYAQNYAQSDLEVKVI